MPKVLISGYYGYKNFGDETILKVLTEHLKSLNADITVISSDTEYTKRTYNVNSIRNFDINEVINSIKHTDIVISGGGSLFQDVTSLKSLLYYAFILSLAIFFNKKTIIFAQGIGPLNSKISQIIVKNILKNCSYISVRDKNSKLLLNKWKINSNLVCDPVFSLNLNKSENNNTVGIQLRDFKTINYNLLNKLALLINNKFPNKKIKILVLQKTLDYEIANKFKNIINQINPNIKVEIVSDNIIEHISNLEYLFAMRYHAILIALKTNVKTCAINYDIKVQKLAQDANIPMISVSAEENFEQIYEQIININTDNISEFVNKQIFDWSDINSIITRHPH